MAEAAQAVEVAAPAPALTLAAPVATEQALPQSFSGHCLGGFCNYVSGFSCDRIIRNSGIRSVSGGTQESATRPARRPPGTVSPNEVSAGKSNRRKVNQDPVKTPPDL